MRAMTRLIAVVAVVVATSVVVTTPSGAIVDGWVDVNDVYRVYGEDRYATAANLALDGWPSGSSAAIVTTGENWPDALAAGPAARAFSIPVLLTRRDSLPLVTASTLAVLGVSRVVVVGGPAAVSDAVVNELATLYQVDRVWGTDRYETAVAVANFFPIDPTFTGDANRVIVVRGDGYIDALVASLFWEGRLLLVPPGQPLSPSAMTFLYATNPDYVGFEGDTNVLMPAITQTDPSFPVGIDLEYDPFVRTAYNSGTFPLPPIPVVLVTGDNWPDAIAAAPYAGQWSAAAFVSHRDCVPYAVMEALDNIDPAFITIVGGPAALGANIGQLISC